MNMRTLLLAALLVPGVAWGQVQRAPINAATPAIAGAVKPDGRSLTTTGTGRLQPPSLARLPTSTDDAAHGQAAGAFWLAPDGSVLQSKFAAAGAAIWGPRASISGVNYEFPALLPCDYTATVFCGGSTVLKSGWTGNLVRVIRASDGTTQDVGLVNGAPDTRTLDKFCFATTCRVAIFYDQSGGANNATGASIYLATTSSNAASTGSTYAILNITGVQAAGVTVGMFVDTAAAQCIGDHVTAVTTNTVTISSFDGLGSDPPCGLASGVGVLFGSAPTMNPTSLIGSARSIVFDRPFDSRSVGKQYLTLPSGVTVTENAHAVLAAGRVMQIANGTNLYSLNTSGAGSQSEVYSWGPNGYVTIKHQLSDNTTWGANNGFALGTMSGVQSSFYWVNGGATLSAGVNESTFASGAPLGNATLTGGTIGTNLGNTANVSANYGSQEIGAFVVASAALTAPQLQAAQASLISALRLPAQARDPNIVVVDDWNGQGSVTEYGKDYPRVLSDLMPNWRVTNYSATGQKMCNADTNYANLHLGNSVNTNLKNNILVIDASPNDYNNPGPGPNAESIQEACLTSVWSKAAVSGFSKVITILYPVSPHFVSGNQTYQTNINTWVRANAAANVTVLDMANDAAFAGAWNSDWTITQNQWDMNTVGHTIIAQRLSDVIAASLVPAP